MTLKIEFYLKENNLPEKPLYAKIKCNNEIAEFPLGKKTKELHFNALTQSKEISNFLKESRQTIRVIYNRMVETEETITAEKVKQNFLEWKKNQ